MASSSGDSLSPPRLPSFGKQRSVRGSQVHGDSRALSAKLVRMCEIMGNSGRCKNILEKFCQRGRYGAIRQQLLHCRESSSPQGTQGKSVGFPCVPLCTSVPPVVKPLTYSSPRRQSAITDESVHG